MEKRFGSPKRQDGLMKVGRNKYDLFFGFGKENEEDTSGWNYYHRFTHRPTLDEIKAVINRQIDADTDETILHGMTWEGKPVKLDSESQTNLLGLLLSAQGGMATFPKKYKLGDYPDGSAAYHEFADATEFIAFVSAAIAHKDNAYAKGWNEKEALEKSNWSAFTINE